MEEARKIISGNIAKRQKSIDKLSDMVQNVKLTPRGAVQVQAAIDREKHAVQVQAAIDREKHAVQVQAAIDREKHAIEALNIVLAEMGLREVLTSD